MNRFNLLVSVFGTALLWANSAHAEGTDAGVLDLNRLEPGALPALSYDSDTGLGVGALVNRVPRPGSASSELAWEQCRTKSVMLIEGGACARRTV